MAITAKKRRTDGWTSVLRFFASEFTRDPVPLHRHFRVPTGLDDQTVLLGPDHSSDDTTGGYDIVALLDRADHLPVPLLLLPLRADQEKIENGDNREDIKKQDERAAGPFSRASRERQRLFDQGVAPSVKLSHLGRRAAARRAACTTPLAPGTVPATPHST